MTRQQLVHRSSGHARVYERTASAVFRRTAETYGGLSNMAPGFELKVNGHLIRTSEALYQACRFPHQPEVQALILAEKSPMSAKMRSKPFRHLTRPDWEDTRVRIMRWCLRVKAAQNWATFAELLLSTRHLPIVEESSRDEFWGARASDAGVLRGTNALGRLLMELRSDMEHHEGDPIAEVQPPSLPDFLLLGQPIRVVRGDEAPGRVDPPRYRPRRHVAQRTLDDWLLPGE